MDPVSCQTTTYACDNAGNNPKAVRNNETNVWREICMGGWNGVGKSLFLHGWVERCEKYACVGMC